LTERLDWADKRGIEPPAFALAQARAAGLEISFCDDAKKCCRADSQAINTVGNERSCCRDVQARPSGDRKNHIVAWRALACRGQSMNWLGAAPNMIIARPALSRETPLIDWLGPASSDVARVESIDPAVPPPELA
jgi:hypothetical protein